MPCSVCNHKHCHLQSFPTRRSSDLVRLVRKHVPLTMDYHGNQFFVGIDARNVATPLFLVLVLVEFTDLIFAVDSIPAIFGITEDPLDRKSTRLNSSHSQISYAVFCL